MGIFSGIKNNLKKSEAAVVVQNLLEIQQRKGFAVSSPQILASTIIGGAWDEKPYFFDGSKYRRPHKITIAAISLARYCERYPTDTDHEAALSSLATALDELQKNPDKYELQDIDYKFIELATKIFEKLVPELG